MRRMATVGVLLSSLAFAGPKGKFIDLGGGNPNATPGLKAVLARLEGNRRPQDRDAALMQLDEKLRTKGQELTDPDAIDPMVGALLEKITDDMAAATDFYKWEGDESPRADLLAAQTLLLMPGRTSTGFSRAFVTHPVGRRMDKTYLGQELKLVAKVAKSEADFFEQVDTKAWGAAVHPVLALDGVARVAVSLLSPGKKDRPGPAHQRPVWVAYFSQAKPGELWSLTAFEPVSVREQKLQEANVLPTDGRVKPQEAHAKLTLALRMEDVRLIPPTRTAFYGREASWFSLKGLTTCPVEPKTVAWLDPYKKSDAPLVRAAAVLKAADFGVKVSAEELQDIIDHVKVTSVVDDAKARLSNLKK